MAPERPKPAPPPTSSLLQRTLSLNLIVTLRVMLCPSTGINTVAKEMTITIPVLNTSSGSHWYWCHGWSTLWTWKQSRALCFAQLQRKSGMVSRKPTPSRKIRLNSLRSSSDSSLWFWSNCVQWPVQTLDDVMPLWIRTS